MSNVSNLISITINILEITDKSTYLTHPCTCFRAHEILNRYVIIAVTVIR